MIWGIDYTSAFTELTAIPIISVIRASMHYSLEAECSSDMQYIASDRTYMIFYGPEPQEKQTM